MKIRRKKKPAARNLAWLLAAGAMLQYSASAPENIWAKEPNTEDPFDRKGAGRPDRWSRDPEPFRPNDRWRPWDDPNRRPLDSKPRLLAELADTGKTIAFDIPPQSLSTALMQFGEQAGLQVAYTTEDVQGLETTGVTGTYTPEEALALLLARTGIQYRVTGPNTVRLQKKGPPGSVMGPVTGGVAAGAGAAMASDSGSDKRPVDEQSDKPVKVQEVLIREKRELTPAVDSPDGYKADVSSEAVLRFPAPIQELPQSVSIVTKDSIRDRRAVTQQQAVEGIAGIGKGPQFGATRSDTYIIRGFDVSPFAPGYTRDNGLAAFNNYVADPTLYERIEVIKGPASFTSGLVAAGGFVNRLLKAPVKDNFVVAEAGAGSYGHYRSTLDANGVMPTIPQLSGRFVFTQNQDAEFFRNTGNQRFSFLPSVRFATDNDFSLTVTGNVQRLRGKGYWGTPTTTQGLIPAGIEDSLLGNDNQLKIDYRSLHVDAEKKFAQGFRLKVKGQYSHDESSYRYAYGYQPNGIGPDGNFSIYAFGRDWKRESFAGEVNLTNEFLLFGNISSVAAGMDLSVGRQWQKAHHLCPLAPGILEAPM